MYIKPSERGPAQRVRRSPPKRWRDRPIVWLSVLLHGLVLLALWLQRVPAVAPEPPPSSEVAVVFDNPSGPLPASTASPEPASVPQASIGNPNAPVASPTQDTTPPGAAASVEPPATEAAEASNPATAPSVAPPVLASLEPAPQLPTQAPAPPATVSLRSDELLFHLPPLVLPEPPPLPPLPPRTLPPPPVVRPPARPASPFGNPQDWSFNGSAHSSTPGRASRGFDFGVKQQGGSSEADMSYVAGAHPSGDWNSAIKRWAQARIYYPEQAAANGEEGVSGVLVAIDRSGHVLSVKLEQSAHSPFLDGAWLDIWRNSHVPQFTPDMTEPTTTIRFNLYYHLIRR